MSDQMPDNFWRDLDKVEEEKFRQWARDHYVPGSLINSLWHPVVKDECVKINNGGSNVVEAGSSN